MNKDNAYSDFCDMVRKSWTYGRMTDEEQTKCFESLYWVSSQHLLKGTYKVRWGILQAVYSAFLMGIGYTNYGDWRENHA